MRGAPFNTFPERRLAKPPQSRMLPLGVAKPAQLRLLIPMNDAQGLPKELTTRFSRPSIVTGALTWGAGGREGLYGAFDGATIVSYGNNSPCQTGATQMGYVISIRPDSTMLATTVGGVINKRGSFSSLHEFSLGFNYNTTGTFSCTQGSSIGGTGAEYNFSTSGWSTSEFQQIICTFDNARGALKRWRLWRNGVELALSSASFDNSSSLSQQVTPFVLGQVNNSGALDYKGHLAYVMIFQGPIEPYVQQIFEDPWSFVLGTSTPYLTMPNAGTIIRNVERRTLPETGTRIGSRQVH